MSEVATGRVLHLVPPNGGGVDRFVRDLCAHRPADWLLHVSGEQWVVECPAEALMIPIDANDMQALTAHRALGRAAVLHVHSTVAEVRDATALLVAAMDLPYLVTLHDVEFAGPGREATPQEQRQRREFVLGAAACTAPSEFIRQLALDVLGDAMACTVIENGVDLASDPGPVPAPTQEFPIAVIGAMGPHKGLDHLVEVSQHLPASMRIALLGYADGELGPGWLRADRLWVHGVFEPAQLSGLAAGYGAHIAFFPRGQPESYCYALSDAWLAGLPVVGPDWGAIGERVRAHGGGRLYHPDAPVEEVAALLVEMLTQVENRQLDVGGAARSLGSVAAMVAAMNEIYARLAVPAEAADVQGLKAAAATHLDSRFFRRELLRLQGDLTAAGEQRDNALRELRQLARNFEERGEWAEHLQSGCDTLKQTVEELQVSAGSTRAALEQLRAEHQALAQLHQEQARTCHELAQTYEVLHARHDQLVTRLKAPLGLLPAPVRSWIINFAKRRFLARKDSHG